MIVRYYHASITPPTHHDASAQLIPNTATGSLPDEVSLFHQRPKMLLERVAVAAGQADGFRHGDAAMLPDEFDNPQCKGGQGGQHQLLTLQLAVEPANLLGQ